jgi:hypothetical protein
MTGAATEPSRHLVLVHTAGWQDVANFQAIKAHVEEMAPDIRVFIASNDIRSSFTRKKSAVLPSLIFSPLKLWHFQPERGKIYQGQPMSKLTEMHRLTEAGMPVPEFEEIGPETKLSAATYGPYTIVKPSFELASWGQGIELRRTEDVRYRPPSDYPSEHPGRHAPMIAQRFIDCGKPMSCRVLTLFGAPLFTYCRESTRPLALDPARSAYEQADFLPAPPDVVRYATHDPAFLDLAAAAYRAMPDVALQACDIVREKTGKLYLLEVNPGGGTWMFSSPNAPSYRANLGTEDLTAEFDAFRTCARVLIERTRAEAI